MKEGVFSLLTETSGVEVAYYYTCKTQLWLFSHGIDIANSTKTEDILIGRIIHEANYEREKKEYSLFRSKFDVIKIGNKVTVYERKKGVFTYSHRMQLLFYLLQLKLEGFENVEGILIAPGKRERVLLTPKNEEEIFLALKEIKKIKSLPNPPPPEKIPTCRRCAYKEFCFGGHDE